MDNRLCRTGDPGQGTELHPSKKHQDNVAINNSELCPGTAA